MHSTTNVCATTGWLTKLRKGEGGVSRRGQRGNRRYFTLAETTLKWFGKKDQAGALLDEKGQEDVLGAVVTANAAQVRHTGVVSALQTPI